MDGSPNNSFIPKRGPASKPRRVSSRQIYIFTLVSYVLFFGTLVAAAGVFFYQQYVTDQLQQEVVALDNEIELFEESDMETVRNFEARLNYTEERVNNSVSFLALFTALEEATAQTAQIENLSIERREDSLYEVIADMRTNNFDSSFFQREFFEQSLLTNVALVDNLSIDTATDAEQGTEATSISFTASLGIPVSAIPSDPVGLLPSSPRPTPTQTDSDSLDDEILPDNELSV